MIGGKPPVVQQLSGPYSVAVSGELAGELMRELMGFSRRELLL
jgi:hypothetical protein